MGLRGDAPALQACPRELTVLKSHGSLDCSDHLDKSAELGAPLNGIFQWGQSLTSVFSRTLSWMRDSDLPSPPWRVDPALVLGDAAQSRRLSDTRVGLCFKRGGGWKRAAVGESESGTKPAFLCLNPNTPPPSQEEGGKCVLAKASVTWNQGPAAGVEGAWAPGAQRESQCELPTGTAHPLLRAWRGRQVMVPLGTLWALLTAGEGC